MLAAESGVRQPLEDLQFYEEGGFGGTIHGETVMMGSAYFMKQSKVTLPRDLKLKTGVFLSVDGQLIAIFAIKYQASRNVDWALRAVRRNRIQPVLAVREGNVTPGLLKRKFSFDVKPVYPDVSTRLALSELTEQRGEPNAVIYREGLMPFAETVIGSRPAPARRPRGDDPRLFRRARGAAAELLSDGAGQHGFTAPDADAGVSRPVARAAGTAEWARETLLKRRGG